MDPIQAYLKYYIEAHKTENKLISITDLRGSAIELPYFSSNMALISPNPEDRVFIPEDLLGLWVKQLHLYQSRKQLIGTALAYKNAEGKALPIFIFPCRIQKLATRYHIVSDFGEAHINPAFINEMRTIVVNDVLVKLVETLESMDQITDRELLWVEAFVEKNIKTCSSQLDLTQKRLVDPDSYRSLPKTSFFNQLSVGVIARSSTTASLLSDFEMLIRSTKFSKPLQRLFKNHSLRASNRKLRLFNGLPLSQAQKDICSNSIQEHLSVVIGPPGTGKSFTMSALAIQLVENGYSVLISSKTNQAVDIVYRMVQVEWGGMNYTLRPGLGKYRKQFSEELKRIRRAGRKAKNLKSLSAELKKAGEDLEKFNRDIQDQIEGELSLSKYLRGESPSIIMDLWAKYKLYRKDKSSTTISSKQNKLEYFKKVLLKLELENLESRQLSLIKSKYNRVINLTDSFVASITSRSLNWRKKLKSDFNYKEFFKYFPLWLCKANEIGHYFPQKKELFDFILVDEASQMDIATSSPLMQRGKHVICFGDHKQLRHVSFLSKKKEEKLALSSFYKIPDDLISYRSNSLLDLVEDRLSNKQELNLLDEHYRSLPSLIQFSNHFYYNKCLKVMQSLSEDKKAIVFHRLEGMRNRNGVNEVEARYIIDLLQKNIVENSHYSFGIISPFRNQVDFITKLCLSSFSLEEIESLRLRIDTPYGFQGDERDVVYISMVIDLENKRQSMQYLRSPGIWNVCITRAKKEQHLIHSFNEEMLPENNIIRNYFEFQHHVSRTDSNYTDLFVIEVKVYLESIGIRDIYVNRDIGALQMDLSFFHEEIPYVIDLVGYPGQQEEGLSAEDQALLHRMKIRLMIVLYSDWIHRPLKVKSDILTVLKQ